MKFTGERVVPNQMQNDVDTLTQHLARYIFALKYCARKRVLDAACGTGYGLEIMSWVASEIYGVDIDNDTIIYAEEHFGFSNRKRAFYVRDLSNNYFSSIPWRECVDVITSFETIEHLENPDFFLENVKIALVPGGHFIFSIPNTNPSQFHKKVYDLNDAQKLISDHFQNVKWFGQNDIDIGARASDKNFFIGVAVK